MLYLVTNRTVCFYASATDSYRRMHYVFRLSVRECVRPGARPVSTISYKRMNGISPNFGWWCSSGDRWTYCLFKVEGSRSRSRSSIWV